ncbi:hypothetical protein NQ315_006785 [Exocentrus adspersus]|uniref:Invertebrate defensins family profile domain-containing protein n=1 Tax=Exocentrus adspersus TaxID=1586481 RepID=A0AAV8WBQ8_9CUCU|nr:hypothetical protein NQ315_006785 [Exocentrus adspersus]
MKFFVTFALILSLVLAVISAPAIEEGNPEHQKVLLRTRRYTCNVLKSNAWCSLHCVALGKPGGHCSKGTCYCSQW